MYLAGRDEFCRKTRILSFNFHKGDGESRRKAKLNTEYMKFKQRFVRIPCNQPDANFEQTQISFVPSESSVFNPVEPLS